MADKIKADTPKQDPEQSEEFQKLVAEKKELWAKVKGNPKFLETEQYKRINEIDKKLWELVKS